MHLWKKLTISTAWFLNGIQQIQEPCQKDLELFDEYAVNELDNFLSHYGDDKFDICNGDELRQKADLNPVVVQAEWNNFIRMVSQHRNPHEKVNQSLTNINQYLTDTENQFYKILVIG